MTIRKPDWIRVKLPANNNLSKVNRLLREGHHKTVCEEANCPNKAECFGCGTATFLIMGDTCTRHCKFCNVTCGFPKPLDLQEPSNLARTVSEMKLKYLVITSVTRDDLKDGGAMHYVECINEVRKLNPNIKIEILVPDFQNCMDYALDILAEAKVDVFNHNIETVFRLHKQICPNCDYEQSLLLLKKYKMRFPETPTKSGLIVGLGETKEDIKKTLLDLRENHVEMLTIGQYLQPSKKHLPVSRYVTPDEFKQFKIFAHKIGFSQVSSGPMVRSSYHADLQSSGCDIS